MFEPEHQRLGEVAPRGMSRPELIDLLGGLDGLGARVAERRLAVLAEIDALDDSGLDAEAVGRGVSRRSARQARREAETAAGLSEMPRVANSLAEGRITTEHAEQVARAAGRTSGDAAETGLLELAERLPADLLTRETNLWLAKRTSPAEAEARHQAQRAERGLSMWPESENGSLIIHGQLDKATGKDFQAAVEEKVDELWRRDGGRDGTPGDVRTSKQRRVDAIVEMVTGSAAPTGTRHVRHLVHVIVNAASADATYLDGSPVPPGVLMELGPTADIVGHLFSGEGQPLWVGRRYRLATEAQWMALIASTRGCVDCGASPEGCQAHHVVDWVKGGPTNITNLQLKCHTDHGLAHRGSRKPDQHRGPPPGLRAAA